MTIVVTTPTGHVGSRVVRLLLQAGVRPRLLLRDPARLEEGTQPLVDAVTGDLTDPEYVRAGLKGARTVFWADPTPHTSADPIETSLRTAAPLFDAAQRGDVERVVFLSSVGAELRHGVGHIDALGQIEEGLNSTGVDVTHLRCGYFFTNLLSEVDSLADGVLATSADPHQVMAWVDPRDIAEVVAARLLNDDWAGQHVQGVYGPENLTFARVAEILTDVLDRPIRLQTVSDDEVRAGMREAGLPDDAIEGIVGMIAGGRGRTPQPPRDLLSTTPTTLAAWAYEHLRPLLRNR
ncbi:NmrA family NAD(P)-binding protein [Actinomadura hibisca]|uniref:NmrA family NAD(P)-binding protein n=1 Tax=Actinomadura hibisca TaxID=68565 RepID=UPI0008371DB3|nr:NAD(P)H-binding protein [Actinomadura hibisca]